MTIGSWTELVEETMDIVGAKEAAVTVVTKVEVDRDAHPLVATTDQHREEPLKT